MNTVSQEQLIELAFALASNEPLDEKYDRLLERVRDDKTLNAQFSGTLEFVRRVRMLRGAGITTAAQDTCLDDNAIAEFVDGVLAREERTLAERHLAACDRCLKQAVALRLLTEELTPRASVREFVLQWARKGLELVKRPAEGFQLAPLAPAAVLGTDTALAPCCWTQQVDDIEVEFAAVSRPDGRMDLSLRAMRHGAPLTDALIILHSYDGMLQAQQLSKSGDLLLDALEADFFALEIRPREGNPVEFHVALRM